jgi:hypothetical protein
MKKMSQMIRSTGLYMTVERPKRGRQKRRAGSAHVDLPVTFHLPGRTAQFSIDWYTGWRELDPSNINDVSDVLEGLLDMARTVEQNPTFGDWAGAWASDPDTRPTREIHAEHIRMTRELKEFIGSHNWRAWVYETGSYRG